MLVLDDYHVIDARDIHEGLAFLLDHLPPQLHLVIASRADPPLPLARLRARGELTELRAADLRFTPDEAAAFLNEVMGLDSAAADVAALEARTEGWIAGLQLAALSMQGRDDVAGFIAGFAGDDRYIVDYLVEEVLQRQPERVRSFLLQTAILDRLSGPLCDAVTGQDGRQRAAGGAGARQPLRRPAGRPAPLVSLSPPLCRRARARICWTSSPTGRRRCTGARARGTSSNGRAGRCDPPRAGRRGFRARGGPGRAGSAGHAQEQTGGHVAWLAQGAPRRAGPPPARAQRCVCLGVTG